MHKLTTLAVAVSLSLLLSACQEQTPDSQADTVSIQTTTLNAPLSSDMGQTTLIAPQGTGLNLHQDGVSFISPLSGLYQSRQADLTQHLVSDEYWFAISGAELNRGVNLNLTQGGAVVRIAPRADTSSGALYHAAPVAPEQLELTAPKGTNLPELVRSMADSEALATAGMTDNSSALLLSASAPAGEYRLKARQPVDERGLYLVNVKEKGSPFKLTLANPMTVGLGNDAMALSLQLEGVDAELQTHARLRHAGTEQAVTLKHEGELMQLSLPDNLSTEPYAGLSELVIDISAANGDNTIRRTIKSAVKLYSPSGRIEPGVTTHWQQGQPTGVTLALALAGAGRFEASAVLTGTNAQGEEVAILRTQAAAWFDSNGELTLPLSPDLIAASGLKAPFQLRELELKDQGQMALLSFQDRALTL